MSLPAHGDPDGMKPAVLLLRCFATTCREATLENNADLNSHIFCDAPLGLLFIHSYVMKHLPEVDCKLIDGEALMQENAAKGMEKNWDILIDQITSTNPQVIGLSQSYYAGAPLFHETCRRIKEVLPEVVIVGGGNYPTDGIAFVLDDLNLDYVIQSEGEFTFTQFLERYFSGQDVGEIDGICYRNQNQELIFNKKVEFIKNIGVLPPPDRSVVPMHLYGSGRNIIQRVDPSAKFLTLIASRGCPYKCTFCSNKIFWGGNIKYRSVEDVLDEIEELKYEHGANVVGFNDDNFLLNRRIAGDVMQGLIDRRSNVKWIAHGGSNVRVLLKDKGAYLDRAVESGLCFLNLAIESGNDEILKAMDKPLVASEALELIELCRSHYPRLYLNSNFMVGFPYETRAQIESNFDFSASLGLDWCVYPIVRPYPKTELYHYCLENGLIEEFNFEALKNVESVDTSASELNGVDWTSEWLTDYAYEKNLKINFVDSHNMKIGNYRQAIKDFEYVLGLTNNHAVGYRLSAVAAYKMGQFEKANEYAKKELHILATHKNPPTDGCQRTWSEYYEALNLVRPRGIDLAAISEKYTSPARDDLERLLDARREKYTMPPQVNAEPLMAAQIAN